MRSVLYIHNIDLTAFSIFALFDESAIYREHDMRFFRPASKVPGFKTIEIIYKIYIYWKLSDLAQIFLYCGQINSHDPFLMIA